LLIISKNKDCKLRIILKEYDIKKYDYSMH